MPHCYSDGTLMLKSGTGDLLWAVDYDAHALSLWQADDGHEVGEIPESNPWADTPPLLRMEFGSFDSLCVLGQLIVSLGAKMLEDEENEQGD